MASTDLFLQGSTRDAEVKKTELGLTGLEGKGMRLWWPVFAIVLALTLGTRMYNVSTSAGIKRRWNLRTNRHHQSLPLKPYGRTSYFELFQFSVQSLSKTIANPLLDFWAVLLQLFFPLCNSKNYDKTFEFLIKRR